MVTAAEKNTGSCHVTIRGLGLRSGERWLFRNLDLEVKRGRFIAVVGPSGVGKSTFLGCLNGLVTPTEGEIEFCCLQRGRHTPANFQGHTGVVFQHNLLVPNSSVLTNVLCGRLGRYPWWRTLFGFPQPDRESAFRILADLGLAAYTHRWVCETSGGEQQRAAFARALFQEPELYLADEPVSNLDTYMTGRVLGILRQEVTLHGRTVFCVLHNPDLVERFADHVLSFDPTDATAWNYREVRR
ncbi:MAG: ATP-binding cassette domain-containing protein [Opitutaceae bacterium]|nr:ATP-binding cassette domain-containing protein [Opitutaceae bacterium]